MRRKPKEGFLVTITCDDGIALPEKKVTQLPLREDVIVEQSIYYFDDPEPCMIHRSAVMKRIFSEFLDYFESLLPQDGPAEVKAALPENLMQKLDINGKIEFVTVRRG